MLDPLILPWRRSAVRIRHIQCTPITKLINVITHQTTVVDEEEEEEEVEDMSVGIKSRVEQIR